MPPCVLIGVMPLFGQAGLALIRINLFAEEVLSGFAYYPLVQTPFPRNVV